MRTTARKTLGLLAMIAMALGLTALLPSVAHAQTSCEANIADYEGSAIITVDPVSVTPGGTVVLTGTGFPPNSIVPLYFNDELIGQPVTDADGNFTFTYTIPADITSGTFEFSAACGTFILTASITITPVVPPTQAPQPPLPTTGSSSTTRVAQAALALLAVGGVLVVSTRRSARHRELVGS